MKNMLFNLVRVVATIALLCTIGANAESTWVAKAYGQEVGVLTTIVEKEEIAEEYAAICAVLGGEPTLYGVSIEEYVKCCRAWSGHKIVAAELACDYYWVETDRYKTGLLDETVVYGVEFGDDYIDCIDTQGKHFKVYNFDC